MDSVLIEGLLVNAVIGVFDWEREIEQVLSVDLDLSWDNRIPGKSDDVADALDYGQVAERVRTCVQQGRFQLLEAAAEAIVADLQAAFGVRRLVVTIRKPGAVPGAQAVGVRVQRGEA